MKRFIIDGSTYTVAGDKAVIEISRRLGWKTSQDLEGNILVEYPEADQALFEMLSWEEDSYTDLESIEKSWG